ncbi:hypothetical protein DSO57_1028396 [Entomophthora muscae]|uniref:Uncharacterized protein n=1 Tax=Entomophthora muscae TaxID=34485 RepID=A0ACC2TZR0_9FUNG|nr:hypothetical protein DSO57_1028396 [Entomophthora muscae]
MLLNPPLRVYHRSNHLDKCILATFQGAQVFRNSGQRIFDAGVPCIWYTAIQFTFMFLYMTKSLPPSHWAIGPAKDGVLFFYSHLERNADRWAILRDAFFTLKPLMSGIHSKPDNATI